MTSVLCLADAFGSPNNLPKQLGEEITTGNTVVPVDYNDWGAWDANVDDGVAKFDAALHATFGPKIGFGFGLGAVVLTKWLENEGPGSDIDPSDLSFVLLGNPARTYGGLLHAADYTGLFVDVNGHSWMAVSPPTIPADTGYTVVDLARQYDGFCDYPDVTGDPNYWLAQLNAWMGCGTLHADYTKQSLTDADNEILVEGNVTYLLAPTMPMPLVAPNLNPWAVQSDAALRPKIEACYTRTCKPAGPPKFVTEPYPQLATVECAEPDHFYVRDGGIAPQPWMQWRAVATGDAPGGSITLATYGDTNHDDFLHRVTVSWINLSPMPQAVYGIITRGGCRVTLQARTRGYLQVLSAIGKGPWPPTDLVECSREGIGADAGLGGLLAAGTGYCDAETRQNDSSYLLAPERTGWMVLEPGEQVIGVAELRFVTEYYEPAAIDGGDLECDSSLATGDTRLDFYATPVIEPGSIVGGAMAAHAPQTFTFYSKKTLLGAAAKQYFRVPAWADYLAVITLGGGGSGQSEELINMGQGGRAGRFNAVILQVGVDVSADEELEIVVGLGGAQPWFYFLNGNPGGDSKVTWGTGYVTGPGGAGGNWQLPVLFEYGGEGVEPFLFNKVWYEGGAASKINQPGNPPGGAGGGAFFFLFGAGGADGRVWIEAWQTYETVVS